MRGEENDDAPELYSRQYSIVYNPNTKKYDVYELPTNTSNNGKDLVKSLETSVDSIIDSNPILTKYYRKSSSSQINTVSAIFITVGIVIGIIGATILVGRYYKKVRKQRA